MSKQIDIGTIALRKKDLHACLQVTPEYLNHIWGISNSESLLLVMDLRTVESVLDVRDVESVSAEVTRISPPQKRRLWSD